MTETPHRLSVRMSRRLVPRHEVAGLNPRKAFWNSFSGAVYVLVAIVQIRLRLVFPSGGEAIRVVLR